MGGRRRYPLVAVVAVFVSILVAAMWVHAPVADGVTRSFRLSGKSIALTIDDGPDPVYTPVVIDILGEHDARATFFVIGEAAARHPDLISRIVEEGHEVAFHTHTHPHAERLRESQVLREIDEGLAVLRRQGVQPVWYRPPRGRLTDMQKRVVAARGMKVALWTRCMERSRFATAREMAATLADETRGGDVVLAHDGRANRSMTIEALPLYLEALRRRDISVVTLSELEERAPLRPLGVARPVKSGTD